MVRSLDYSGHLFIIVVASQWAQQGHYTVSLYLNVSIIKTKKKMPQKNRTLSNLEVEVSDPPLCLLPLDSADLQTLGGIAQVERSAEVCPRVSPPAAQRPRQRGEGGVLQQRSFCP